MPLALSRRSGVQSSGSVLAAQISFPPRTNFSLGIAAPRRNAALCNGMYLNWHG